MTQIVRPSASTKAVVHGREYWQAAALILLVFAAFGSTLGNKFVNWDDDFYVYKNTLLNDAEGLREIWNPFSSRNPQYYPLVFTSYWLEFHLVGLKPFVFHLTNVSLHAANSILVWLLARHLGLARGAAWVVAAVFAVHPLQAFTVAWVTERKNLMACLFFLAAALTYIRYRRGGSLRWYAACLLAFVLALLAKTQIVLLPLVLWAFEWLLAKRLDLVPMRRIRLLAALGPMVAIGAAFATLTVVVERRTMAAAADSVMLAPYPRPRISLPQERPFIAARAAWTYVGRLVAPFGLSPVDRRWDMRKPAAGYVAAAAVIVALVVAVVLRRRWNAWIAWGAIQGACSLLPALGLIPFGYQVYAFTSNHFVYFSMIGGALVLVVAAQTALSRLCPPAASHRLGVAVTVVTLAACVAIDVRESGRWRDSDRFWARVAEHDPDSFAAAFNLGHLHFSTGRFAQAAEFYRKACVLRPEEELQFARLVECLIRSSPTPASAVIDASNEKLAQLPNFTLAVLARGEARAQSGDVDAACGDLSRVVSELPADNAMSKRAVDAMRRLNCR